MHHIKQEVRKEQVVVLPGALGGNTTSSLSSTMNNNNTIITKKSSGKGAQAQLPTDTETIQFFAGNPVVEITEGKIHLYKNEIRDEKDKQIKRSELICVLAVPSYMSPSDFAAFTGAFHKVITNMRILRDNSSDTYMVVIKLVSQEAADEFFCEFNGKPFSSMERESCSVLYVASVEFIKPSETAVMFPPTEQIELPTCPVCLERLDESISGILTILCNHSFHCQCLSKWKGENSCPVCRYCQQPDAQSPMCSVCHTTESLWICLICGNVGCGRYVNEHARQHYKETMHAYALELQTSRVWDYVGDGLVQNKSDGELVEFPAQTKAQELAPEGKIESITLEYSYLLEAQRTYFEEQIRRIERDKFKKIHALEEEYAQLLETKESQNQKIREIEEEKKRGDKKVSSLEKKMKDVLKETQFLKQMNEALEQNQKEWKIKIEETEKRLTEQSTKKIAELQDQIKDLMFYIEAKEKVADNGELQDGQLVVVPGSTTNNKKSKKKKGKT